MRFFGARYWFWETGIFIWMAAVLVTIVATVYSVVPFLRLRGLEEEMVDRTQIRPNLDLVTFESVVFLGKGAYQTSHTL
ncbi:MAG TPA: hypothetical protein VGE01_05395, partial [Fimbriimonas sp.]